MPEIAEQNDVLKPFEGPPATPDNFTAAFPEMERAAKGGAGVGTASMPGVIPQRGRIPLDAISERKLGELRRQVRANPFPAATVINLHPWALQSQDMFLRGIVVPACNPGQDYAYHHIRAWNADKQYSEDGSHFVFTAIRPIDKAAQFLIKFADAEVYGGGVIVYEGDHNPNKVKEVELYSPDGRPIVDSREGFEYDDEGNKLPAKVEVPIRGSLHELIEKQRQSRNEFYLRRVTEADEWFKSQDSKDRRKITQMHRLMAEVLVAEGILSEAPDWNLASKIDKNKGEVRQCKSCGASIQGDPYRCTNAGCGNILKPLEAFMDGAIEWGHAKLELLAPEQYAIAEAEHKRRQEVKKARKTATKE